MTLSIEIKYNLPGTYNEWYQYLKRNGLSDNEANSIASSMGNRIIKMMNLNQESLIKN